MSLTRQDAFKHVTAERVFTPVDANARRRSPSRSPREVQVVEHPESRDDDARSSSSCCCCCCISTHIHTPMAFAPLLRQVSKADNPFATTADHFPARSAARRSHGWPRSHAQALSLR